MKLTNSAGDPIRLIPQFSEPWIIPWNPPKFIMAAKTIPTGQSCPSLLQFYPLADPDPLPNKLLIHGQSVEGTLKLDNLFPNLYSVLATCDVQLEWTYYPFQWVGFSIKPLNAVGGSLTIPRYTIRERESGCK